MPTINSRLDCIEELLSNERMLASLAGALGSVLDLDHLLSNLVQSMSVE